MMSLFFIYYSETRLFICLCFMIVIIIYIYSYVVMYVFIYRPSYQHSKAFPLSKFNSETSFLYQLFKEDSNFRVKKPCKEDSKFNSETSFLYQLFKENSNFRDTEPCNVICKSIFL